MITDQRKFWAEIWMRVKVGLLIAVLAGIAKVAVGQDKPHNMVIDNGGLFWNAVVEVENRDSANVGNYMLERLRTQGSITEVENNEGQYLTFKIKDLLLDPRKYGVKRMAMPAIYKSGLWSATGRVDIKQGRYRVSIKDLVCVYNLGQIGFSDVISGNTTYTSESLFLNKARTKYNLNQFDNMLIIDAAFKYLFVNEQVKKDDW